LVYFVKYKINIFGLKLSTVKEKPSKQRGKSDISD